MNSNRDRNQILLKTPVIVSYYLFFVTELRNVLFINFVCYFTEFKVRKYKFVFINNCLSTLTANTKRNHVIAPLLTVKVGRSPNLAIVTVHFGLYNLLPLIFTFLFSESTQKLFFKFHLLRHDS